MESTNKILDDEFVSFFDGDKFPFNESDFYEYKESYNKDIFDKYLETICGFLNTNGGNLIFGITDNLDTVGLNKKNETEIDKIVLRFDSIIGNDNIMGNSIDVPDSDNSQCSNSLLRHYNIVTKIIKNKHNKKFLWIKVKPDEKIKYHLAKTGFVYYRLGASNYKEKVERLYTQRQFDSACANYELRAEQTNKENIELFQKTLKDKEQKIDELNQKISVYSTHLSNYSTHHNQQLIVANQTNALTKLFETFFPCFKYK